MSIRIPDELAAEADRYPLRFRPDAPLDASVLILGQENPRGGYHVGMTGKVSDAGLSGEIIVTTAVGRARARAWAIIGSADSPSSPRPQTGDRVLVLDGDEEAVGAVCEFCDESVGGKTIIVVHEQRVEVPASRWAILPPTPGPLVPELPDRPAETVNIERDRRASVVELADVLDLEFGQFRPGEPTIRGAIRVMREQRAQLNDLRAKLDRVEAGGNS